MEDNKQIAKKEDYGALVINQVGTLVNTGLTMPKDYNYVNAVKASMLVLNEMTDKQGNKILPQCLGKRKSVALQQFFDNGRIGEGRHSGLLVG